METTKRKYQPGKMRPIIALAASMIKKDLTLLDDPDYGRLCAQLRLSIPELGDPSHCANCGAGMKSQIRRIDYHIIALLQSMGRIVVANQTEGMVFTEANKIHVNAHPDIAHNARNMTGIASALGLIAPVAGKEAHWAITARGWAGLRGDSIPYQVEIFRDTIVNRFEETITFSEVLTQSKSDKAHSTGYSPSEWYEFGENQPPKLL